MIRVSHIMVIGGACRVVTEQLPVQIVQFDVWNQMMRYLGEDAVCLRHVVKPDFEFDHGLQRHKMYLVTDANAVAY